MAKFTDDYFAFPIKIYDGFSLKKAMDEEEMGVEATADWISGVIRIPVKEFLEHRVFWHDGFSRGRSIEEVASDGFDITLVCSEVYGDFSCTWERKKFEEKLNEFISKRNSKEEPSY